MYGVSRRMCYVRVTYVWRMKCTRDVSTAYVSYVLFLSAAYLFCTICFFKIYENKRLCSLCSYNSNIFNLLLSITMAAPVAERLRALFLNHSIISPLCLVWVRALLWPQVRQAKFCLRVCQVVFLGDVPFSPHLLIGPSHMS